MSAPEVRSTTKFQVLRGEDEEEQVLEKASPPPSEATTTTSTNSHDGTSLSTDPLQNTDFAADQDPSAVLLEIKVGGGVLSSEEESSPSATEAKKADKENAPNEEPATEKVIFVAEGETSSKKVSETTTGNLTPTKKEEVADPQEIAMSEGPEASPRQPETEELSAESEPKEEIVETPAITEPKEGEEDTSEQPDFADLEVAAITSFDPAKNDPAQPSQQQPITQVVEQEQSAKEKTNATVGANKPTLLVLCSNQSLKREVTANQGKVCTMLKAKGIDYKTLDGADAVNKDRRNQLFEISGKRAVYPQFFLEGADGALTFWGDWERFEMSNETGSLVQDLGVEASPPVAVSRSVPVTKTKVASPTGESTNAPPVPAAAEVKTASLLVLCSKQSLDREVVANQEKAYTILASYGISYDTLDGAEITNRERRNELFGISNLRAVYPQFFLVRGNATPEYWGEWDRFEAANKMGTLCQDLGFPEPKKQEAPSSDRGVEDTTMATSPAAAPEAGLEANDAQPKNPEEEPESSTSRTKTEQAPGATAENASEPEKTESSPPTDQAEDSTSAPTPDRGLPSSEADDDTKEEVTASTSRSIGEAVPTKREIQTDITIYGATGHVGKHCATYLMQKSLSFDGILQVTLAGRNAASLEKVRAELSKKMGHLATIYPDATGRCIFDTVAADSTDAQAINAMVARSKVVVQCAGPFSECGTNIIACCARTGADYVDITGEVSWAGEMRTIYGEAASKSGARIISLCGFDCAPVDLAVQAAVEGLRKECEPGNVEIESATVWHHTLGGANGGTIRTAASMPLNFIKCFFRKVPFLLDDPLVLTHPRTRFDPNMEGTRERLAKAEWANQRPIFHTVFNYGASCPFLMAPVDAKVVHASAIALKYGPNFTFKDRYLPVGFKMTTRMRFVSVIPALIVQLGILIGTFILKFPFIGNFLTSWLAPPGSGMSEADCRAGVCEMYAEVSTAVDESTGLVSRANCLLEFHGDPANWVTSQCVCEAALALIIDKDRLPPRSEDGFGTPAELLGIVLLERMHNSTIRPLSVTVDVRKATTEREWKMFP